MYSSPQDDEFDNDYDTTKHSNFKLRKQLLLYRVTTSLFGIGLFIMAILKLNESTIVCDQ